MTRYALQEWMPKYDRYTWITIDTSTSKTVILEAYTKQCRLIRDGTFRIRTAKGSVVKIRRGSLYKKVYKK